MPTGRWFRISGNHPDLGLPATAPGTRYLEDNDPAKDATLNPAKGPREILRRMLGRRPRSPWHGRAGFSAITEAWNGAAYAPGFGASGAMIVFGGGHDDYFGSDVHAFDLRSREWSRISDGYVSGDPGDYGAGAVYPGAAYPDGSPLPPHTYGYVQYDAIGNDYLLLKGQLELGPQVKAAPIPHLFNLDSLRWRTGPKHPSAVLASGGCSAWDASRRILWGHSGDDGDTFTGFRPDGDNRDGTFGSWGARYPGKFPGTASHNTMRIDTPRDIIVTAVHASNRLYGIDPAMPDRAAALLASSGEQPILAACAALEYAPSLDCLAYYSAADGPRIYAINAPAGSTWGELTSGPWRWSCLLDDGNTLDPVADAQERSSHAVNRQHTFGRFRVAAYATTDIALLVRHVDTPVYAMRLN